MHPYTFCCPTPGHLSCRPLSCMFQMCPWSNSVDLNGLITSSTYLKVLQKPGNDPVFDSGVLTSKTCRTLAVEALLLHTTALLPNLWYSRCSRMICIPHHRCNNFLKRPKMRFSIVGLRDFFTLLSQLRCWCWKRWGGLRFPLSFIPKMLGPH